MCLLNNSKLNLLLSELVQTWKCECTFVILTIFFHYFKKQKGEEKESILNTISGCLYAETEMDAKYCSYLQNYTDKFPIIATVPQWSGA